MRAAVCVQWTPKEQAMADSGDQALGGKVELSLLHFAVTNPEFQPPPESRAFVQGMRTQVRERVELSRKACVHKYARIKP